MAGSVGSTVVGSTVGAAGNGFFFNNKAPMRSAPTASRPSGDGMDYLASSWRRVATR
jgi:hypothetical protein